MRMPSISVLIIFIDLTFGLKIRNSKTYPQWSLHPLRFPRLRGTETSGTRGCNRPPVLGTATL